MRLPSHLEIAALIRLAESRGGNATVLAKGERDAGTILVATLCRGADGRLYERMPQLDETRRFVQTKVQDAENSQEFFEYLTRRASQDPDLWVLEVDVDDPARFIADLPV